MEKFKGTKGEWKLIEYHYGQLIGIKVVSDNEDGEETIIHDTDTSGYIDNEQEANAKLISCAPEMLSKLKETMEVLKWYMNNTHPDDNQHESFFNIGMNDITEIEQLIKKATTL